MALVTVWLVTIWWLSFITAIALCVGSFLNAVIYRLPRDQSLRSPLWSMCPSCKHRIHWYDNIPILSFVMLRGRCRHCTVPIGTHYVVVEILMALVVLMLLDAFFIGHVRNGMSQSQFGLTDHLAADWPMLVAHVTLFACLLPMSIIDLEHYWVDIRFTNVATVVGFAMHTIWTPRHAAEWIRPSDSTAAMAIAAMIGLLVTWAWLKYTHLVDETLDDATEVSPTSETQKKRRLPPSLATPSRAAAWIAAALLGAKLFALLIDETGTADLRHTGRALLPLLFIFALIVWEFTAQRPADQEIADAIHEERHNARSMAFSELVLLSPALILGLIGWWVTAHADGGANPIGDTLHARIDVLGMRHWTPMLGFSTAASGYIIAGGLGWAIRILFTLIFGKEAFGTGDIHLMAAAGAVTGWQIVVLGFLLTCGLAILGWIVSLPFKKTRAIPLGPWLSLAFLTVVVYYDSIVAWPVVQRVIYLTNALLAENSQFPAMEGIR